MFDAILVLFYPLFFLSLVWPLVLVPILLDRKPCYVQGGELLALATTPCSFASLAVMRGSLRIWDVGGYFALYGLLLLVLSGAVALASTLHFPRSIDRPRPKRPRSGRWIHRAGFAFTIAYSLSLLVTIGLAM